IMHMSGLFLLFWIAAAAAQTDPLLVELPNGKVLGRDRGKYYSFESIPYANPPVDELRFEPPQPYTRKWVEPFNGTSPPVFCMQWSQLVGDENKLLGVEDCLTISIYKPKKSSAHEVFPVVVEIHGGAFMFTVSDSRSHEAFMSNGNVILVKFNYRVGPLGFANTGDKTMPGNYGLKDQRLALRWIKKNIDCFNGDPKNMIVIGLAAGGASAHLQMMHKEFEQVAKGAITMSGNALSPWVVQKGGRRRAVELGRIVGCGLLNNSEELKKCLKEKPASEIVSAVRQFLVFDFVPFTTFSPVVEPSDADDPFLVEHPIEIIKSGKFSQVPWLATYAKEDGGYNAALLLKKGCNGEELISELNSRWFELAPHFLFYQNSVETVTDLDDYSLQLRQQYLGNRDFSVASYLDVQRMFTDALYKNGTQLSIELQRKYGKSPIYAFVYDNPADQGVGQWLSQRSDIFFGLYTFLNLIKLMAIMFPSLGSVHGDDFLLIFENSIRQPLRPDEREISKHLIGMVQRFAKSGTLVYNKCQFQDNIGEKKLQLLAIKRDSCENLQLENFP
ncbi:hypothetical protein KR222_003238, partial [Zaprionus bogoriensis]